MAGQHEQADRPTTVAFLEALIAATPYRLHTMLTDNGIQFADLPRNRDGWTARYRVHRFDQQHGSCSRRDLGGDFGEMEVWS